MPQYIDVQLAPFQIKIEQHLTFVSTLINIKLCLFCLYLQFTQTSKIKYIVAQLIKFTSADYISKLKLLKQNVTINTKLSKLKQLR